MKLNKLLILTLSFTFFCLKFISAQTLGNKLEFLSEEYNFSFELLETNAFFNEKYAIDFNQPLDHNDADGDTFSQRIFISHLNFQSPVVFITEGYAADYAAKPNYVNELSTILQANQICVEHRYFGESVPPSLNWEYLNTFQAASDHHRVIELIRKIYEGPLVSTGISKGGQTAMFHRYYYPDDVEATVGYVCPLNFSIEDKRVYKFLDQVGDSASRKTIYNYQIEMLKHKSNYLPYFQALAEKENLTYPMGILNGYELTVLEYSFAFWQWGTTDVNSIPNDQHDPEKMVDHLNQVAGIDWVSEEGISKLLPFFYQAMTEIGFYGYDITPFEDFISFSDNPTFKFTIPQEITYNYQPEIMERVDCFMRHEADKIILIYGELDPWSATSVDITMQNDVLKIINPGGSHLTRISNLPEKERSLVISTLKDWLELP